MNNTLLDVRNKFGFGVFGMGLGTWLGIIITVYPWQWGLFLVTLGILIIFWPKKKTVQR